MSWRRLDGNMYARTYPRHFVVDSLKKLANKDHFVPVNNFSFTFTAYKKALVYILLKAK